MENTKRVKIDMRKFILPFFILFFFFLSFAQEIHRSIHFMEHEKYKDIIPMPIKNRGFYGKFSFGALSTPIVSKEVMGFYVYWYTGTSSLRWGLLTILAYFSCDVNAQGDITNFHGWPNSAPIDEAHSHGVKVLLTATLFNGGDIRTLIQSSSNRSNLIENLYEAVSSAGADGVCIDFEYPYSSDREYFTTFIEELSNYFHSNMPDSIVSIATPAVNWNDRFDFNSLTNYADYLFIMAYDYYWSGGDPGPNSPLDYVDGSPWYSWASVKKTIEDYLYGDYGVGDGKKNKLLLGVPYYGHKWPTTDCSIPGDSSDTGGAVLYATAVDEAMTYGRNWDNYSSTPYYMYDCSSSPHQVWYDDEESLGLKWDLVNQYDIGGTGMWALNYDGDRDELWNKIEEKFVQNIPGTINNPILIETSPYVDNNDTSKNIQSLFDYYSCAPNTNESGPEICYKLVTEKSGDILVNVVDGVGVDIDVHILDGTSSSDCLDRGHHSAAVFNVPAGTYYIVADSWVGSDGTVYDGAYTLTVEFIPEDEWISNQIADGLLFKRKSYSNLFSSKQFVNVLDVDLKDHFFKIFPVFKSECDTLSNLVSSNGGKCGVNCGWVGDGCTLNSFLKRDYTLYALNPSDRPPRATYGIDYFQNQWIMRIGGGSDWPQVPNAIGGGPLIVRDGEVVSDPLGVEGFDSSLDERDSRCALGITYDDHLLLITVDKNGNAGDGMSISELAQYMVWLNCKDAMLLGSGSSTTMYVEGEVVNGVVNLPDSNGVEDHLGEESVPAALVVEKISDVDSDGDGLSDDIDPEIHVKHFDVNGDGVVDIGDYLILANYLCENIAYGISPFNFPGCGDGNLDGKFNSVDLILMLRKIN